ncbi:hypothetical protein [Sulfobacillus sp. hq2]|uniref:hypothetical protein n=1 Tax=Sulfobacillus TaxID=28033 RepID=UPI000CD2B59B|nr:hypothetical protein [Sulfobacillus sp. hq2]POB10266.1 hypothetical protein CO251_09920 [Sulfobacillus sp. hq2]
MERAHAVIVGMGQIGRTLGEGLLMAGYTVTPVLRGQRYPTDDALRPFIIATGEDDLAPALERLPEPIKKASSVVLLQNELLPSQWEPVGILNPTLFVVWFERKLGKLISVLRPSVVFGPQQAAIQEAMDRLGLACQQADSFHEAMEQVVIKNVYIWATNIASLRVGGTTGELVKNHFALVRSLSHEALAMQEAVMQQRFDGDRVMDEVIAALKADPAHQAGGRSAKRRLERFLAHAAAEKIDVPVAQDIAKAHGLSPKL